MATARLAIRPLADDLPIGTTAFLTARNVIRVRSAPLPESHAPEPQTVPFPWIRSLFMAAVALAVVAIALVVAMILLPDDQYVSQKAATMGGAAAAGTLSMFATFYVAAQAIERLLEPFSAALLNKDAVDGDYASKVDDAAKKAEDLATLAGTSSPTVAKLASATSAVEAALQAVAAAKNEVDIRSQARTAIFWALASAAGIGASASLKLYFLLLVGISPAPRWIEVLATGLIIGSGTKPLHDLISTISDKKDVAAATAAVAKVATDG
jgi:methyl-accepting chemotaxis protein